MKDKNFYEKNAEQIANEANLIEDTKVVMEQHFDQVRIDNSLDEEWSKWIPECPVFISAQTGSGKTSFVERVIVYQCMEQNKSVLIVSNRQAIGVMLKKRIAEIYNYPLYNDIKRCFKVGLLRDIIKIEDIRTEPAIKIVTYQSLVHLLNQESFVNIYDYVILDECHYFIEDALFNSLTEKCLQLIVGKLNQSVRIYMTATEENVFTPICQKEKEANCLGSVPKNIWENNRVELLNLLAKRVKGNELRQFCYGNNHDRVVLNPALLHQGMVEAEILPDGDIENKKNIISLLWNEENLNVTHPILGRRIINGKKILADFMITQEDYEVQKIFNQLKRVTALSAIVANTSSQEDFQSVADFIENRMGYEEFIANGAVCNMRKYCFKRDWSAYEPYYFVMENSEDSILFQLIDKADPNDKWFIFVDSYSDGKAIRDKVGKRAVMISKETLNSEKSAAKKVYNSLLQKENIGDKDILIATKILDCGINIKDYAIKNVVIISSDKTEIIQAMGRLRLNNFAEDENEKIQLFFGIASESTLVDRIESVIESRTDAIDSKKFCKAPGRWLRENIPRHCYIEESVWPNKIKAGLAPDQHIVQAHYNEFAFEKIDERLHFFEKMTGLCFLENSPVTRKDVVRKDAVKEKLNYDVFLNNYKEFLFTIVGQHVSDAKNKVKEFQRLAEEKKRMLEEKWEKAIPDFRNDLENYMNSLMGENDDKEITMEEKNKIICKIKELLKSHELEQNTDDQYKIPSIMKIDAICDGAENDNKVTGSGTTTVTNFFKAHDLHYTLGSVKNGKVMLKKSIKK